MKTLFKGVLAGLCFRGIKIIPILGSILVISISSCTTPFMVSQYPDGGYATPPDWAQNYNDENPVNYYYLPDIETYYDLRNRDFVYLDNGNWRFSASLPAMSASFDLNNCFVVKLNNAVNEPWMHFQYYVSHYPRYYYQSVGGGDYSDNHNHARWFNENLRQYGYDNNRGNNQFANRNEQRQGSALRRDPNNTNFNQRRANTSEASNVRQNAASQQVQPLNNQGFASRKQPMKYYGRQIGQPVKVRRYMMKPKEGKQQQTKLLNRRGREGN